MSEQLPLFTPTPTRWGVVCPYGSFLHAHASAAAWPHGPPPVPRELQAAHKADPRAYALIDGAWHVVDAGKLKRLELPSGTSAERDG